MDINTYIRSELRKELGALNAKIDKAIEGKRTGSNDYKRMCLEHRKIIAVLRS